MMTGLLAWLDGEVVNVDVDMALLWKGSKPMTNTRMMQSEEASWGTHMVGLAKVATTTNDGAAED